MKELLPINELLEEWLNWAVWINSKDRDESMAGDLIGHDEFTSLAKENPEYAWKAILAAIKDPRQEPFWDVLVAGPLEDLLSYHGPDFIERVEVEARSNKRFATLLGGVWKFQMREDIWSRVQSVWDRRGWDGIS